MFYIMQVYFSHFCMDNLLFSQRACIRWTTRRQEQPTRELRDTAGARHVTTTNDVRKSYLISQRTILRINHMKKT